MKKFLFPLVIFLFFTACNQKRRAISYKPVIYLYPKTEQAVSVKLGYEGNFTVTYPEYMEGWKVWAKPDGTLINLSDSLEYSYLFWEGSNYRTNHGIYDSGFVVKGEDAATFLQKTLRQIGLTAREYNEFIVYWYPILKENEYNFIHFITTEEYDQIATLNVQPQPESVLRVFMDYKAIDSFVEIPAQVFDPFRRTGFTVIEWGGGEIPFEIKMTSSDS